MHSLKNAHQTSQNFLSSHKRVMTFPGIVINGTAYDYDQVRNKNYEPKTDFEDATLNFICQWLEGKERFLLTTSGSTGTPKQIEITRDQMVASAKLTERALALKPNFTSLICLDTKYIAGRMMLVRSLVTGMNMIANEPSANPLAQLGNDRIDFAAFVPYQLSTIIEQSPEKLNQIKIAIVGGGRVEPELHQRLRSLDCQCYETFGMTETLSHIALRKLNGENATSSFTTLPGIIISKDKRGCLVLDVPYLATPVVTNDLVDIIDTTQFIWLGRWDNVINSGGAKVIPEKVENTLKDLFHEMSRSHRFFIAGLADQMLGQKVCLIIEGEELPDAEIKMIKEKIKASVPRFEVPKDIYFVKKFVDTETGKINRPETLKLFPARFPK